ncbi:hypothetical protein RHMOL_Rhmol05G0085100 [Rhododendron molle]|uniref:Uncharacterized protein n=1 Tax=Rhododendron molle TaxID=49168 RepID=A0ACC0NLM1_RHOML|nr:hypothetical protein RHMOL_Rhmol05G0085100 [Rhododendron molle]
MFVAEMSSDSFQLHPKFFARDHWDPILCVGPNFAFVAQLPRDYGCRELLVLFWNDNGVYCICDAKD